MIYCFMNIRQKVQKLNSEQNKKLIKFRERRQFEVEKYVKLKCDLLKDYFSKSNLKTAIIAVSGGIDSAVVLGLVKLAGIDIIAVTLPNYNSEGVSNQKQSAAKARIAAEFFGVKLHEIKIDRTVDSIQNDLSSVSSELNSKNSIWAEGQLSPYTRLPYLCYCATLAADAGKPGCIVGTTNRDEGAYLGYVGKFSDGAVDIQLISDLHKSEVYQVACYLEIPDEIINAVPTGDMFDGSADEEIFGSTYDGVELHLNERQKDQLGQNLDNLHNYNKHKYRVGSPAVHLDLYESGTENGWPLDFENKYWAELEKQGDIIKPCFVAPLPFTKITFDSPEKGKVLSESEIQQLTTLFNNGVKKIANTNGYVAEGIMGSERASLYNVKLAKILWGRLRPNLELLQQAENPITDWQKGEIYRLVGINPLFRFIGYNSGGELTTHYDYSAKLGEYKTIFSLVFYLTSNEFGATIFYEDPQGSEWDKNLEDKPLNWKGKITERVCPEAGKALIFPHHKLHSGEKVKDFKLIIRTDIVAQCIKCI